MVGVAGSPSALIDAACFSPPKSLGLCMLEAPDMARRLSFGSAWLTLTSEWSHLIHTHTHTHTHTNTCMDENTQVHVQFNINLNLNSVLSSLAKSDSSSSPLQSLLCSVSGQNRWCVRQKAATFTAA